MGREYISQAQLVQARRATALRQTQEGRDREGHDFSRADARRSVDPPSAGFAVFNTR